MLLVNQIRPPGPGERREAEGVKKRMRNRRRSTRFCLSAPEGSSFLANLSTIHIFQFSPERQRKRKQVTRGYNIVADGWAGGI